LDDAVSFRKLEDGEGYEIGVHISDVAFFLTENTPLDEEVCQRATTTYLVQSVRNSAAKALNYLDLFFHAFEFLGLPHAST
jgi:RNB domain